MKINRMLAAVLAAGLAFSVAGCKTDQSDAKPQMKLVEQVYVLPDNSLHVVAGTTHEGLFMTSRETSAYHCSPKCDPVPMVGSSGPGVVPVLAGLAGQIGSASIIGGAIRGASGGSSSMTINNGSTNINANNLRSTQVDHQTTGVYTLTSANAVY